MKNAKNSIFTLDPQIFFPDMTLYSNDAFIAFYPHKKIRDFSSLISEKIEEVPGLMVHMQMEGEGAVTEV